MYPNQGKGRSGMSKTALVTGVSRGLGYHICSLLKLDGFRVLGVGKDSESSNPSVDRYLTADFVSGYSLQDTFLDESIDVLINNAAIYRDDPRRGYGPIPSLLVSDLVATFHVNFFAAVSLTLRVLPGMVNTGFGRIVNVSSGMARFSDIDDTSFAYRSSKLALNSLSAAISHYFSDNLRDLSAFSYCPGWIRTEMGTQEAPIVPKEAAGGLLRQLRRPALETNGRFFRMERQLDWCET